MKDAIRYMDLKYLLNLICFIDQTLKKCHQYKATEKRKHKCATPLIPNVKTVVVIPIWHYRSTFQSVLNDFKFVVDLVHRIKRPAVKKSAQSG